MSLSVVSHVAYDADAARSRGEPKRPRANSQRGKAAEPSGFTSQDLDADPSEAEESVSTAGLSILAQALAAYSQS